MVSTGGEAGCCSRLHRVSKSSLKLSAFGIFVNRSLYRVAGYKSYECFCEWLSGKLSETVEIMAIQNSTYPAITFCPQGEARSSSKEDGFNTEIMRNCDLLLLVAVLFTFS